MSDACGCYQWQKTRLKPGTIKAKAAAETWWKSTMSVGLSEDHSFDTIVLLGRNTTSKHFIRSTILSYDDIRPQQCTYEVSCEINSRWISIVETDLTDPGAEITILEYMAPSNESLFLLVLQQDLLSEENIALFSYLQQTFGHDIVDRLVPTLVINKEKTSCNIADQNLEMIVGACGGRLCALYSDMDRMEVMDELQEFSKISQSKRKWSENPTSEEFQPIYFSPPEETEQEDSEIEVNQRASTPDKTEIGGGNTMTIVLLGQTGSGKSATGNTILARRHFESRASSTAVTQECERAEGLVFGMKVRVIDTPDFFNEELKDPEIHVQKCKELSQQEPVVYLLVMHMGRFTEGEREIISRIQKTFGEEVVEKVIILFTGKEKLKGKPLSDFIKIADSRLQKLIRITGSRCHAFNNNSKRRHQVKQLMEMILQMQMKQGLNLEELFPDYRKNNTSCTIL